MLFDRAEIRAALEALAAELSTRKINARVLIVGGAAMALAYSEREGTNDIDGMYQPADEVNDAAAVIAQRRGYPTDWLNDNAKQFSAVGGDVAPRTILERGGVRISVAGPRYMLAMKLRAARGRRDIEDIEALLDACEIKSVEGAEELLEEFYPDHVLSEKARAVVAAHLRG